MKNWEVWVWWMVWLCGGFLVVGLVVHVPALRHMFTDVVALKENAELLAGVWRSGRYSWWEVVGWDYAERVVRLGGELVGFPWWASSRVWQWHVFWASLVYGLGSFWLAYGVYWLVLGLGLWVGWRGLGLSPYGVFVSPLFWVWVCFPLREGLLLVSLGLFWRGVVLRQVVYVVLGGLGLLVRPPVLALGVVGWVVVVVWWWLARRVRSVVFWLFFLGVVVIVWVVGSLVLCEYLSLLQRQFTSLIGTYSCSVFAYFPRVGEVCLWVSALSVVQAVYMVVVCGGGHWLLVLLGIELGVALFGLWIVGRGRKLPVWVLGVNISAWLALLMLSMVVGNVVSVYRYMSPFVVLLSGWLVQGVVGWRRC